jgi:hypothetical protein
MTNTRTYKPSWHARRLRRAIIAGRLPVWWPHEPLRCAVVSLLCQQLEHGLDAHEFRAAVLRQKDSLPRDLVTRAQIAETLATHTTITRLLADVVDQPNPTALRECIRGLL